MRMFLAVIMTMLTTFQWYLIIDHVARERQIRHEFSPEVIALAHVNLSLRPALIWNAVISTFIVALLWCWVIWEAEKS